jgi:hypothetical protein
MGGYHRIRELMRELISVNLNASYRALWSDGDSELDRLFVPYRQSNIIQLVLGSNDPEMSWSSETIQCPIRLSI